MSRQGKDTPPVDRIAANVRAELNRTGMTVTELAAAAGTSEKAIYRVMGAQHDLRLSSVERIARVFGRDVAWFYADHSEKPNGNEQAA